MNWAAAAAWLMQMTDAPRDLLRYATNRVKIGPAKPKVRLPRGVQPIPIPKLKKAAWDAFSIYIRRRDADENGNVRCCTCGAWRSWKAMDAGHFVSRVFESTLFDEKNVHAQCKGCNMPPNYGRPIEYAKFIDDRYGSGSADILKSNTRHRGMPRWELESILEKYVQLNKDFANG